MTFPLVNPVMSRLCLGYRTLRVNHTKWDLENPLLLAVTGHAQQLPRPENNLVRYICVSLSKKTVASEMNSYIMA